MVHWVALKRILRYLDGTVDYGIHYKGHSSRDQSTTQESVDLPRVYMASNSPLEVASIHPMDYTDHVNSDYANSLDDMRSVTEYVNFLAEGSVTLQSRTQASVSLYSMVAKYISLAVEVQQTDQQRMMFKELRLPFFNANNFQRRRQRVSAGC